MRDWGYAIPQAEAWGIKKGPMPQPLGCGVVKHRAAKIRELMG